MENALNVGFVLFNINNFESGEVFELQMCIYIRRLEGCQSPCDSN